MTVVLFFGAISFAFACVSVWRWRCANQAFKRMVGSQFSDTATVEAFLDEIGEFIPMALSAAVALLFALAANLTGGETESNTWTAITMVLLILFTAVNVLTLSLIETMRQVVRTSESQEMPNQQRWLGYRPAD